MMVAITIRRAVLAAAVLGLVVGAAGRARADLLINFDDVSTRWQTRCRAPSLPARVRRVPLVQF